MRIPEFSKPRMPRGRKAHSLFEQNPPVMNKPNPDTPPFCLVVGNSDYSSFTANSLVCQVFFSATVFFSAKDWGRVKGIRVKLSDHFDLDVEHLDRLEYARFERFEGGFP